MNNIPLAGLKNIGNTCYMNAALQIFMRFEELILLINNGNFNTDTLINAQSFIKEYIQNKVIVPRNIKNSVAKKHKKFRGSTQEDSHEFLFEFIDMLDDELKKTFKTSNQLSIEENIIDKLFNINVKTILKSQETTEKSITSHPNRFLFFSLTNNPNDLNECLKEYFNTEILDGDNKWLPEGKNKQKQTAIKASYITSYPKYLIVVFKRYSYDTGRPKKLNNNVKVTHIWKNEVFPDNTYYELIGTINQSGSLNGGHYTACIKLINKWFYCDDPHVSLISDDKVENIAQSSYVLCFKQKRE